MAVVVVVTDSWRGHTQQQTRGSCASKTVIDLITFSQTRTFLDATVLYAGIPRDLRRAHADVWSSEWT